MRFVSLSSSPALRCALLAFGITLIALCTAESAFGHAPDNEQIKRLDAEVRANPADASFLLRRAAVLRAAGRPEAAAEDYEKALLLDPRNVEAHLGRAALLLEAGAIEEAQRTLEACPQGDEGFESQRWRLQSAILRSQHSWVAAAQALDRAIAIDPAPRPEDFMERADLALSAGDADAALAALERGIERLNGAVALRWRAIGIAIRVQRTELALAQLDQLEQVMPESALVRARRGDVFAACGRHLEASAAWTDALERIDSIPAAERSAADQKLAERLRRELRQEAPR